MIKVIDRLVAATVGNPSGAADREDACLRGDIRPSLVGLGRFRKRHRDRGQSGSCYQSQCVSHVQTLQSRVCRWGLSTSIAVVSSSKKSGSIQFFRSQDHCLFRGSAGGAVTALSRHPAHLARPVGFSAPQSDPHPRISAFALTREERAEARVSKDGPRASWFETARRANQ